MIVILLDEGAYIYFKLVRFAALDESQAFFVALLGRGGTFCKNVL